MLKQVFDKEQLSKTITPSDVWQWDLLPFHGDVKSAVDHTVQYWESHNLALFPLVKSTAKGKSIFTPAKMEDAFAIKLMDRFIRRIYRVRQSDRNRIVRQLITLLKDSGDYNILRLDINNCYESVSFKKLIDKFEDEMILAPQCVSLLHRIYLDLSRNQHMQGLPRGLPISPTLAELYLESLDEKIASHTDVIYSARYVDDIIILTPAGKEVAVQKYVESVMCELGLRLNAKPSKYYSGTSRKAQFNYLGYSIEVEHKKNQPNKVKIIVAPEKIRKIKSRIAVSLIKFKADRDFSMLKKRIKYICMLKVVKKGRNGDLLAGIAHNYQYVTDGFRCLKPIDGFLCEQLVNPRFALSPVEQDEIRKISVYGNVRNGRVGKFSKKQTAQIMRVWKNA